MENITEIIFNFSKDLLEKVDGLVKFIVLFGSTARKENKEDSDIDILIVIDDITPEYKLTDISFYNENLRKILSSKEEYKKIHPITIPLSTFYEGILKGDPLIINAIRIGFPIIDPSGFFSTLKELLKLGKIKYTEEAIEELKRKNKLLEDSFNASLFKFLENIYLATLYIAQYYLSKNGSENLEPENIPEELKKLKVNEKAIDYFKKLYEYIKKCSRNLEIIDINKVFEFYEGYYEFKKNLKI